MHVDWFAEVEDLTAFFEDMECTACNSIGAYFIGPWKGTHFAAVICGECGEHLDWGTKTSIGRGAEEASAKPPGHQTRRGPLPGLQHHTRRSRANRPDLRRAPPHRPRRPHRRRIPTRRSEVPRLGLQRSLPRNAYHHATIHSSRTHTGLRDRQQGRNPQPAGTCCGNP